MLTVLRQFLLEDMSLWIGGPLPNLILTPGNKNLEDAGARIGQGSNCVLRTKGTQTSPRQPNTLTELLLNQSHSHLKMVATINILFSKPREEHGGKETESQES